MAAFITGVKRHNSSRAMDFQNLAVDALLTGQPKHPSARITGRSIDFRGFLAKTLLYIFGGKDVEQGRTASDRALTVVEERFNPPCEGFRGPIFVKF